MIYGKTVHTLHFLFLCIKFIVLGSEGFEVGCTLVCTEGDHLSQGNKKPAEAG